MLDFRYQIYNPAFPPKKKNLDFLMDFKSGIGVYVRKYKKVQPSKMVLLYIYLYY